MTRKGPNGRTEARKERNILKPNRRPILINTKSPKRAKKHIPRLGRANRGNARGTGTKGRRKMLWPKIWNPQERKSTRFGHNAPRNMGHLADASARSQEEQKECLLGKAKDGSLLKGFKQVRTQKTQKTTKGPDRHRTGFPRGTEVKNTPHKEDRQFTVDVESTSKKKGMP